MDTPSSKPAHEFRKTGDGYDPEEVDNALTAMQSEVTSLKERVRHAEQGGGGKRSDSGHLHDPDRAVERMLAAAQQTADRVVYEAEAEAERVLAEAQTEADDRTTKAVSQADATTSEAKSQGERIRTEAVTEARRIVEETRQPLVREVKRLRDTRDELRNEIDVLRGLLSSHRDRVRGASDALRALADDPEVFRIADPGPRSEVDVNLEDQFVIEIADSQGEARSEEPKSADSGDTTPSRTSGTSGNKEQATAETSTVRSKTAKQADTPASTSSPKDVPDSDAAASSSGFSAAIADDEVAAPIVTLDDLSNASSGEEELSGAFSDEVDEQSDDDLFRMGENTSGGDEFLSEVRKAADAEDDGLGQVGEEQGRAISNFFEGAIEEPKSRFGRRGKG